MLDERSQMLDRRFQMLVHIKQKTALSQSIRKIRCNSENS
jgi:hypothetical protein